MGCVYIKKREDNILPYNGKYARNVGEDIIFPRKQILHSKGSSALHKLKRDKLHSLDGNVATALEAVLCEN